MSRPTESKQRNKPGSARPNDGPIAGVGKGANSSLPDVIASIGRNDDWARVVELYYWSREPGMLEIIRALIEMPERTRASIEAFLTMSHDPAAVTAVWDSAGRLTLSS